MSIKKKILALPNPYDKSDQALEEEEAANAVFDDALKIISESAQSEVDKMIHRIDSAKVHIVCGSAHIRLSDIRVILDEYRNR